MNDSKRDELLVRIDENVKSLVESRGDHETRIRSLEATKYRQAGMVAVLSAVFSGAWAYVIGSK